MRRIRWRAAGGVHRRSELPAPGEAGLAGVPVRVRSPLPRQFEAQQSAARTIYLRGAAAIVVILLLLCTAFGSLRAALRRVASCNRTSDGPRV